MKRFLALLTALLTALFVLAPAASALPHTAAAETVYVTPAFSEGVTLSYDEAAFSLNCTEVYGLLRVETDKTITLTAQFAEGWTYNADYTNFFRGHDESVTVTENADGSMVFAFSAHKGDYLTRDELLTVGIYATPDALPRFEIETEVPFSQITKDEYVTASFTLTLGTKQFASGDYEGTGSVKGRGNTSWGQPKKPYSIKLDKKASLLDIPKTKKYAIVPSYSDPSLIRNYVAYKSGLMFEGIDYVPKCEFCEVYLNGSYNGIYLLVERVAIETTKVDIAEATAEDLTGGYLIEKDVHDKIDFSSDLWFDSPYWANQNQDYFVLKDPEPDDTALSDQMRAYLAGYMQQLHTAVMDTTSSAYTQYVDTTSWIDFIIMQELAKNVDGNLKTSCYMVKKAQDDKLYMTAPWDFDLAFGNPATTWNNADYTHNDYYDCPDATSPADFMTINSSCPWFDTLYDNHAEFNSALKERYTAYRQTMVPEMLRLMDYAGAYLDAAAVADNAKWGWDFDDGVAALRSWLTSRIEWLDSQWCADIETIDLDFALNTAGGTLHFTTSDPAFTGTVKDGRIVGVSGNAGDDSSTSSMILTLDMQAGETLSFDYKVSSEQGYDLFAFVVNGATMLSGSGEVDWTTYTYTAVSDGSYTFEWRYAKDYSVASGSDCCWVDEVIYSGDELLPQTMLGDADCSGSVTFSDVTALYKHVCGVSELTEQGALNADMDESGNLDFSDISALYQFIIGMN